MSQALDVALVRAVSAAEEGSLTERELPAGARLALASRARQLSDALAPSEPETVRKILSTLSDMPSQTEADRAKLRFALERDVSDLREFPEWALAAAARAYRKGEVGEGKWRPTAGELATYCRRKVLAHAKELLKIERVLKARVEPPRKPISPEQRKSMADQMRAVVQEW